MSLPRFAVYIIAHDAPHLFADLVRSLHHPQIDVYAHIDAKTDQVPFERAVAGSRTTSFVPGKERVSVNWGGASVVHATFAALRIAQRSGVPYHRHTLLSGRDLLLRDLSDLIDSWCGDREHLRVDRSLHDDNTSQAYRITHYQFPDQPYLRRLSGRIARRRQIPRPVWHGSTWWSLTDEAMTLVLDTVAADPGWLHDFRYVLAPDEIVIQSIIMNSPLAQSVSQNYLGRPDSNHSLYAQHYIDWSDVNGISPPDLRVDDLPRALGTGAMFARKVSDDWTWRGGAIPSPQPDAPLGHRGQQ